jgi:hypothetical protein
MSNPNPPFQELSFDPEQVTAVNQAYDLACRTLQNVGQLEVDREIIARGILQAEGSGERDANKLCERAILGLTPVDYRQHGSQNNQRSDRFRVRRGRHRPANQEAGRLIFDVETAS